MLFRVNRFAAILWAVMLLPGVARRRRRRAADERRVLPAEHDDAPESPVIVNAISLIDTTDMLVHLVLTGADK